MLTVIGLYWVASQCRQLYAPKQKLKRNNPGLNQQLIQTALLTDDCIPGPQNRLILVITEPPPSPLLAPLTPQIQDLQQDKVTEEPTLPKPVEPTEDRSLDSETPI